MSVYYNVVESLTVRGGKAPQHIVPDIQYRFSVLGALLLQGEAKVYDCRIKTENGEWSFSGKGVCSEMQAVAQQLEQAEDIDFHLDYGFDWWGGNELSQKVGPMELMSYLCPGEDDAAEQAEDGEEALGEEDKPELPEEGSGFLYSCWHTADCADDAAGVLFAYGEKDGKQYRGVIEPVRVAAEETEGNWYSPDGDFDLGEVYAGQPDAEAMERCEVMKRFHRSPEGSEEPCNELVFPAFHCAEEMKEYFEAAAWLVKNVEYAPFAGIYHDLSGEQMRVLQVDLFTEEQPVYLMTQL